MQLRGPVLVVETVAARKPVISGEGATRSLNETESGSLVVFDRVLGQVFTLPLAKAGTYFDFLVSVASATVKVISNITTGTQFFTGAIAIQGDTAGGAGLGATTTFMPNQTTQYAISMNGTTTGGAKGTFFRAHAISSGTWVISGTSIGTGTIATPFAAS